METKAAELREKTEKRLAQYKAKQNKNKDLDLEAPQSPRPRRPPLDMRNFPSNPSTSRKNITANTVVAGEDEKRPISTSRLRSPSRRVHGGGYIDNRPEGIGSPQREAEERVREKKRREIEATHRKKKEEERKAAELAVEMAKKADALRRKTEERVAYYKKNKAAIDRETKKAQAEVEEERQERERNYLQTREMKTKEFRKQTLLRMKQRQTEVEERLKQEERMKEERLQQRVNYIRANSVHDAHRRPPKSAGASLVTPSSCNQQDGSIMSYEQPSLFKKSASDVDLDVQSRVSGGGRSSSRYSSKIVDHSIEYESGGSGYSNGLNASLGNGKINNNRNHYQDEMENNSGSNHDVNSNDKNIMQFTGGHSAKKNQHKIVPIFDVNTYKNDGDEGQDEDEFEIRDSLDVKPSSKAILPLPAIQSLQSSQQQEHTYTSYETDDISCMTGDETTNWRDSVPDDRSVASGRKKWGEPEAVKIKTKGHKNTKKNPVWKKLAPIPVRAYVQAPVKNEPHSRF